MIGVLPGTTIEVDLSREGAADTILNSVFMAGGLVLSQVSQLTGLESHMIQNWVKRGFLSPPQNKKYTKKQFCRIAIINMLRDSLQLDHIVELISAINGRLDDESDDTVDDSKLYLFFIRIVGLISIDGTPSITLLGTAQSTMESELSDFVEPARTRLNQALGVMVYAYASSLLRRDALIQLTKMI